MFVYYLIYRIFCEGRFDLNGLAYENFSETPVMKRPTMKSFFQKYFKLYRQPKIFRANSLSFTTGFG